MSFLNRNKPPKTTFIHINLKIHRDLVGKVIPPFVALLVATPAYIGNYHPRPSSVPDTVPCPTQGYSSGGLTWN